MIDNKILKPGHEIEKLAPRLGFMRFIFHQTAEEIINIPKRIGFDIEIYFIADLWKQRLAQNERLVGDKRFGLIGKTHDLVKLPVLQLAMQKIQICRRQVIDRLDADFVQPPLISLADSINERNVAAAFSFGQAE